MSYTVISDLFSDQDTYGARKNSSYQQDSYNNGTNQYRQQQPQMYQEQDQYPEQYQQYKKNILPRTKITNYSVPQTLPDMQENRDDVLKMIIDKLSSMSVKDKNVCSCSDELKEIKKKVDSSDIMLKGIILVLFILLIVVLLKK